MYELIISERWGSSAKEGDIHHSPLQANREADAKDGNGDGSLRDRLRLRKDALANSERRLEIDLAGTAKLLLKRLLNGEDIDSDLKDFLEESPLECGQAVYDETIEVIRQWKDNPPKLEVQERVLRTVTEIMQDYPEGLELRKWRDISSFLTNILHSGTSVQRDIAKKFLDHFTADVNCLFELRGHTAVLSVAFSPDGKKLISGEDAIWIWDAETGAQVEEPLTGLRTSPLLSIAISPDGRRVVGGYLDKMIRIWDLFLEKQIGPMLYGHSEWVHSVAISPDGRRIVSGATDKTIRKWDLFKGEEVSYSPLGARHDDMIVAKPGQFGHGLR